MDPHFFESIRAHVGKQAPAAIFPPGEWLIAAGMRHFFRKGGNLPATSGSAQSGGCWPAPATARWPFSVIILTKDFHAQPAFPFRSSSFSPGGSFPRQSSRSHDWIGWRCGRRGVGSHGDRGRTHCGSTKGGRGPIELQGRKEPDQAIGRPLVLRSHAGGRAGGRRGQAGHAEPGTGAPQRLADAERAWPDLRHHPQPRVRARASPTKNITRNAWPSSARASTPPAPPAFPA